MATTCRGADMSAPREVLEELREHIRRERDAGNPKFKDRRAVGEDHKCFLEDLGGLACVLGERGDPRVPGECRYDRRVPTKVEVPEETYPLDPAQAP